MTTPTISVIMINYHGGPYLRPAIESVLAQTRTDFELIIVDDASKDDGPEVIREMAMCDGRIRAVLKDENEGISATRNRGIGMARGKYISLLDGDDLMLPVTLANQIDGFERLRAKHPQLRLLSSDAWLINERGERRGRYMGREYWGRELVDDAPLWTLPSSWLFLREPVVWFHPGYRFSDAPIFLHRMVAAGGVGFLGEPLIEYRLRISSATNALAAKVLRDTNATSKTVALGRLDDPVDPMDIPEPSWSQVTAWRYGRNAKAAMANGRPTLAYRFLAYAALADPMGTLAKVRRVLRQKLRG